MIASNLRPALGGSGDDGGGGGGSGGAGGQHPDMVRKTFWIERQTDWRLRREAYDSGVTEAEIVRAVLREYFGL